MDISFDYYKVFYYAARYKNLTRAAQHLGSSQPGVSRVISLLERQLEVTLVNRTARGITLTPEGERLYEHVRIAVEQLLLAQEELELKKKGGREILSIGTSETALHMTLPYIRAFRKAYPGVRIRISNNLSRMALASLREQSVDFALAVLHRPPEKPLIATPLITFEDVLVGGPAYKNYTEKPLSLAQLTQLPLILLGEGTSTRDQYEQYFSEHLLLLRPELETATTDQILPMVRQDMGVSPIPAVYVKDAIKRGEVYVLPLAEPLPQRTVYLIENEEKPLGSYALKLRESLLSLREHENPAYF